MIKKIKSLFPLSASAALHALMVTLLLVLAARQEQPTPPPQQGSPETFDVEIIEIETPSAAPEKLEIADEGISQPKKEVIEGCKDTPWYGGAGFQHDVMTGIITRVFKGYVADRVGIMPGDLLLSHPGTIRGEPGTLTMLKVLRNNVELSFMITRERICHE